MDGDVKESQLRGDVSLEKIGVSGDCKEGKGKKRKTVRNPIIWIRGEIGWQWKRRISTYPIIIP
jgi:hypothetical protein